MRHQPRPSLFQIMACRLFWTNTALLSTGPLGTNFSHSNILIQGNAFENIVRKMSAILSQPQCVNLTLSTPWILLIHSTTLHPLYTIASIQSRWLKAYQMHILILRASLIQSLVGSLIVGERPGTSVEQPLGSIGITHVIPKGVRQLQVLIRGNTTFKFLKRRNRACDPQGWGQFNSGIGIEIGGIENGIGIENPGIGIGIENWNWIFCNCYHSNN